MSKKITFIDLFSGIGGFHLALHDLGAQCVYACEINKFARKTYTENFIKLSPELFEKDLFKQDITLLDAQNCIPANFDILCAGFPCQPFSIAGHQKAFEDERGNLFFEIVKIIKNKRPKAFFLENVRNLLSINDGKTFQTIKEILTHDLGYSFFYKVIKACDYGLPTLRPRLIMVGFREDIKGPFSFPDPIPLLFTLSDVFKGKCNRKVAKTFRVGGRHSKISDGHCWDSYLVNGEQVQINLDQAKKIMGFPEDFLFPVSKTQAFKQLGNSVAINPIKLIGQKIIEQIKNP